LASEIVGEGCRIFASEVDGELLNKLPVAVAKTVWNEMRDTLAGLPPEIVEGMEDINPAIKYAPPHGVFYTCLKDGEILNVGGYSLRCIMTPGHTPGHMCLWDEANGLMFTGDHVLFDITPNITAWPTMEDSLGCYLDSLRLIREYPVQTALPGHRATGDFHARIDELFEHHEARLAEVENIVRLNPGFSAYDIAARMRWRIRAANWDDFPASQKIFAVGECLSHLNYLSLRNIICRELDVNMYRYHYA